MKIESITRFYNHAMKSRRKELGLSQKALADLSGVSLNFLGDVELMKQPKTQTMTVIRQNLHKLANALDMDFDALFPPEYLELIEAKRLPVTGRFQWIKEVSLDALPSSEVDRVHYLPPPQAEVVDNEILSERIQTFMDHWLEDHEKRVIELRFGLGDTDVHTLDEAAKVLGITRERVRQIQERALRNLRHPTRHGNLREFAIDVRSHPSPVQFESDTGDRWDRLGQRENSVSEYFEKLTESAMAFGPEICAFCHLESEVIYREAGKLWQIIKCPRCNNPVVVGVLHGHSTPEEKDEMMFAIDAFNQYEYQGERVMVQQFHKFLLAEHWRKDEAHFNLHLLEPNLMSETFENQLRRNIG